METKRPSAPTALATPWISLTTYTNAVMAAGVILLAFAVRASVGADAGWLLGLLVLAVATSFFKLSLQLPGGGATMTVGHAVGFLGLLTVGPHVTTLAVVAGIWTQCSYRIEQKKPLDLRRRLFSMACGAITVESAGWIFEAVGGVPGSPTQAPLAAPLVAAALVYFFVNTTLVAVAVAKDNGGTVPSVWHDNFLWSAPSFFISAAVAAGAAVLVEHGGVLLALLFAAPLVLTFMAYRAYLERIAKQREQLRSANHSKGRDHLTGLPNRLMLLELIGRALEQHRLHPGRQCAVLFLDLDGFKLVNDSLGHQAGDRLLQAVATRLETVLRRAVLSSNNGQPPRPIKGACTAARLGGDEFVVLLDDVHGAGDAAQVARQLQETLALPFELEGRQVYVTASVGISVGSATHHNPEDILRDADTAMYRAKRLGKARTEVFDASMREVVLARLQLDTEVRRGIERHEFTPHYQPIIDLATGQLVGFEALLRWQHPERGVLTSGEFIPAMEDTGVVVAAGQQLFGEVCRQLGAWQNVPGGRHLSVSVNFARQQVLEPNFVEGLLAATIEAGVSPSQIVLEITETAAMSDFPLAVEALRRARLAGFQIVLDDFGTGHSSLSCLHELPISGIKLDRSFLTNKRRHPSVLDALVTLAGRLGLTVTAEGVETAAHCAELRGVGCDFAQGYLFAQAVPASAAAAFLNEPHDWLGGGTDSTQRTAARRTLRMVSNGELSVA